MIKKISYENNLAALARRQADPKAAAWVMLQQALRSSSRANVQGAMDAALRLLGQPDAVRYMARRGIRRVVVESMQAEARRLADSLPYGWADCTTRPEDLAPERPAEELAAEAAARRAAQERAAEVQRLVFAPCTWRPGCPHCAALAAAGLDAYGQPLEVK